MAKVSLLISSSPNSVLKKSHWRLILPPAQFHVTRDHGTENPYSSYLVDAKVTYLTVQYVCLWRKNNWKVNDFIFAVSPVHFVCLWRLRPASISRRGQIRLEDGLAFLHQTNQLKCDRKVHGQQDRGHQVCMYKDKEIRLHLIECLPSGQHLSHWWSII